MNMNTYISLKSMSEGDRVWVSPRSIEIMNQGNPKKGLFLDANCVGVTEFSSYYSVLVVKRRGTFLAFLTQTSINVYRTFQFRHFVDRIECKLFLHPKVTFNAHTLCEHYDISTEASLSVIEILEETLFGSPRADASEVAERVSDRLNHLFAGNKTFTSNLPFTSKPFYSISIMPTDFQINDKFLALDTDGFCHFKSLAELKELKEQNSLRVAANG
ncbi:hypothetical protein [Ewingella americana]|uniref:Uncharacterized protein n=1 Tax=Ewingella americana TaxID=41202 RepID=A0A502GEM4_9GAMM|nr:hypothetical protein [Ewingella americana]TPG60072.1 hypothetical protein EAH77_16015 [Ewingella americana]